MLLNGLCGTRFPWILWIEFRWSVDLDGKKLHLYFYQFLTEYTQRPTVLLAVSETLSPIHIKNIFTLQLLPISQKIIYVHHYFKIMVIIRPTVSSCYFWVNKEAYILICQNRIFNILVIAFQHNCLFLLI